MKLLTDTPYLTEDQIAEAMVNVDDPLLWSCVPMKQEHLEMLLQFARALENTVRLNISRGKR